MNDDLNGATLLEALKNSLLALKQLKLRTRELEAAGREPIAIIGMGCRFAGGVTEPEALWDLVERGGDAITQVSRERWDADALYDPDPAVPGKIVTRSAGFISDVYGFDADFFGIAPREARRMDPQQRLLLEVAWEAIEHAKIVPATLMGTRTGVFVGVNTQEYSAPHVNDLSDLDGYVLTGSHASVASGRISYLLGIKGPSVTLDTACSSSLVATHLACQSLRARECDAALAGGVGLLLTPTLHVEFSRLRGLAADGRCKSFDDAADGMGWGEGCGLVVMKRLSEAQRDGDRIWAILRGSAVNQDGRSNGLTAPNGPSQAEVIRDALERAGVRPADVGYVEAHGAGTALGDPIEAQALGAVLAEGRPESNPVWVGSVKSNIGHTMAAAGAAGLIKTVFALRRHVIPRNLHFSRPSRHIAWDRLPLRVPTETMPWQSDGPRIAGVSSFGVSGTNSHLVVEEGPAEEPTPAPDHDRAAHLLVLSAKTSASLGLQIERYAEHLEKADSSFADTCYAAATTRTHFEERTAIVASSAAQARERLLATARGETASGCVSGRVTAKTPRIGFLFTGQGAQYAGMGRELYETEPVFRDVIDSAANALAPLLERPLLSVLYPEDGETGLLDESAYTQPALFAVEYALASLWQSWGITPEAVMGHSLGEYVAGCVAGVFSFEDGLALVAARGRLMQALPPDGEMASVKTDVATVEALIAAYGDEIAIGAYNGPESVVISGRRPRVRAVCEALNARGVKTKPLSISIASHSSLMDPMLDAFDLVAAGIVQRPARGRMKLVSNLTGGIVETEVATPGYWRRHIRQPVRFEQGIHAMRALGVDTFIEIGPRPMLVGMGALCLTDDACAWLPSLKKDEPTWPLLLESLGRLYARGAPIDWTRFDAPFRRTRVALPTYAFHRKEFRAPPAAAAPIIARTGAFALSGVPIEVPGDALHRAVVLGPSRQPYLRDHLVYGRITIPASLYVAVLLAIAADALDAAGVMVRDFQVMRPLVVEEDVTLHVTLTPSAGNEFAVTFCSARSEGQRKTWIEYAQGTLVVSPPPRAAEPGSIAELRRACPDECSADSVYARFARMDVEMGAGWRWLDEARSGSGAALVRIGEREASSAESPFHPTFIDNALIAALVALSDRADGTETSFLFWGFQEFRWYGNRASAAWAHAQSRSEGAETCAYDLEILDDDGRPLAMIDGLTIKRAEKSAFMELLLPEPASAVFAIDWPVIEPSGARSLVGHWLVLTDDMESGTALASRLTAAKATATVGAITDAERNTKPVDGVIVWWRTPGGAGAAADRAHACSLNAIRVVRTIAACRPSNVLWITEGGQAVTSGDAPAPEATSLWGIAGVAAQEYPALDWTLIDAEPGADVDHLWSAIRRADDESELALRNGKRHVRRLVRAPERSLPRALERTSGTERNSGTVLVTGGLGGLGLRVAEWLVHERSVRHLLLVSRGAPTDERAASIEALRAAGATVTIASADVSRASDVAAVLASIPGEAPLRGVIHAAGVACGMALADVDEAAFASVFAPKVAGAFHLHEQTRALDLRFFVLFSSIQSTVGSATQASYAAANAFLDGLAHQRRAQGLVAQSVNWGAWSGEGMASRLDDEERLRLARVGFGMLAPEEALSLLSAAMARPEPQLMIARVDTRAIEAAEQASPVFRALVRPRSRLAVAEGGPGLAKRLRALSGAEQERAVLDIVRAEVAAALRLASPAAVPLDRPLMQLGLDSLMAIDVPKRLKARTAEDYPSTLCFAHPTIRAIAHVVLQRLNSESAQQAMLAEGATAPASMPARAYEEFDL